MANIFSLLVEFTDSYCVSCSRTCSGVSPSSSQAHVDSADVDSCLLCVLKLAVKRVHAAEEQYIRETPSPRLYVPLFFRTLLCMTLLIVLLCY